MYIYIWNHHGYPNGEMDIINLKPCLNLMITDQDKDYWINSHVSWHYMSYYSVTELYNNLAEVKLPT